MTLFTETLGKPGAFRLINSVYETEAPIARLIFDEMKRSAGVEEAAAATLLGSGIFNVTTNSIGMTTFGRQITLLLRVMNGQEDLGDAIRKLGELYPQLKPYELITQNITDYVLDSINARRDFIRLYICSPWIRLDEHQWSKLRAAFAAARTRYANIQTLVITRPEKAYRDASAWKRTIDELHRLPAQVVVHRRLHAKLYMSEPGPRGGTHYAVLGSENLTGANNMELGIKVENDTEILRKLTSYFLDVQAESELVV